MYLAHLLTTSILLRDAYVFLPLGGSEDNGRKDLRDFLRYLKGLPSDGLTGTSICMANFTDIFENFNGVRSNTLSFMTLL